MPKKKKNTTTENTTKKEVIEKEIESKEVVENKEVITKKESVTKNVSKEGEEKPMSEKKKTVKLYFPNLRNHQIATAKGNIKIDDKGIAEVSEELMKFLLQFKSIEFKKVD